MPLEDRTLKICNCNKTMALDARALAGALKLKQPIQIHTELCRKEVGSFQEALKDEACVVACTQEAALFSELAEQANAKTELRFVNIREHAGWSKEGAKATPKIAALLDVNVLITSERGGELPAERRYAVWSGKVKSVKGHLGAFEVAWEQDNPIDLEVCTRCNACIHACPEQAIDS